MNIKLAEALLRRKELQIKVDRLMAIDKKDFFELKTARKSVSEGIDEIVAHVPKVSFQQMTHCYDTHAKALREIDAAIQQANWTTEVDIPETVMADYVDPYVKD